MTFNQEQIAKRNAWFKSVFFPLARDNRTSSIYAKKDADYSGDEYIEAATQIMTALVDRRFVTLDKYFNILSNITEAASIKMNDSAEELAAYIASLCQEKEIYWDDAITPIYTIYEITAFKKTLLGKALTQFGCFISQYDPNNDTTAPKTVVGTTANKTSATSGASTTAQGSSGKPNVADANGLVDSTRKITLTGEVYWISGQFKDTTVTKARIHVKPLRSTDANNNLPVYTNGTGQGAEDCVIFWQDTNKAEEIKNKIELTKHGSKVISYEVKRQKAGGEYYEVNTEFGIAYIKATNFIEAYKHLLEQEFDLLEKFFY